MKPTAPEFRPCRKDLESTSPCAASAGRTIAIRRSCRSNFGVWTTAVLPFPPRARVCCAAGPRWHHLNPPPGFEPPRSPAPSSPSARRWCATRAWSSIAPSAVPDLRQRRAVDHPQDLLVRRLHLRRGAQRRRLLRSVQVPEKPRSTAARGWSRAPQRHSPFGAKSCAGWQRLQAPDPGLQERTWAADGLTWGLEPRHPLLVPGSAGLGSIATERAEGLRRDSQALVRGPALIRSPAGPASPALGHSG
jgi:hypothetical protein